MPGLMDIFGDNDDESPTTTSPVSTQAPEAPTKAPKAPEEPAPFIGSDLSEEVQEAVKKASEAVDAEDSAKAALNARRDALNAKIETELGELSQAWKDAKEAKKEAEELLLKVMQAKKLTKIPMTDRPDVKIKVTPGRKKPLSKKWLDNPEGIVVKTYGAEAPKVIWDAAEKTDPKTEVIVPARYEDEPDR